MSRAGRAKNPPPTPLLPHAIAGGEFEELLRARYLITSMHGKQLPPRILKRFSNSLHSSEVDERGDSHETMRVIAAMERTRTRWRPRTSSASSSADVPDTSERDLKESNDDVAGLHHVTLSVAPDLPPPPHQDVQDVRKETSYFRAQATWKPSSRPDLLPIPADDSMEVEATPAPAPFPQPEAPAPASNPIVSFFNSFRSQASAASIRQDTVSASAPAEDLLAA